MKKYFFVEDIAVLERQIESLLEKIKELGKEQGEAARQSTENFGHDDACQEAIYQERRVVTARLNDIQDLISNAVIVRQENSTDIVRMGTTVELSDGRILRIGSFMIFADYPITNISYNSPLEKALIGKKEGDEIQFRGRLSQLSAFAKQ